MASGLRGTVRGERRVVVRCAGFGVGLATLLAVLCVCFGSAAHHDETGEAGGLGARGMVSVSAALTAGAGDLAPVDQDSLGHSCPPGDRCDSATHAAAITLPAPEPAVPTTLGKAGLPAVPVTAHPVPRSPVPRRAPDLHVLQVQRT
ncbi:hypothetical protein [Streptomyces sp. NPDC051218]|uniref:hypothetical protein n=1 Tax=Streptomyces sp. NPDC051218 TaxID=3365645 RepID=UPI0037B3FB8D